MSESTYVRTLREFGFELLDDAAEKEIEEVTENLRNKLKMPPRHPKEPVVKKDPYFVNFASRTLVIDDQGRTWMTMGNIDLSPFGFNDRTTGFRKLAQGVKRMLTGEGKAH